MSQIEPDVLLRRVQPLVAAQMARRADTVKTNVLARSMWRSSFYVQLPRTQVARKIRRSMIGEYLDTPNGLTEIEAVQQYGDHLRFRIKLVDLTHL